MPRNVICRSLKNFQISFQLPRSVKDIFSLIPLIFFDFSKIVRFFNTVGPRQLGDYGMVIPIFVSKALLGDPLPIFGDGNQRRSFTYIGDVIEGIIKSSSPKLRYVVGLDARLALIARQVLPEKLFFHILKRMSIGD